MFGPKKVACGVEMRVNNQSEKKMKLAKTKLLRIYTLENFLIEINGQLLKFKFKTPKKPLALLKMIVALGGINVNMEKIADALWPDSDGDAALQSFHTTLCRLRKILGHHQLILIQGNKISLNADFVWLDLWEFNYFYRLATEFTLDGRTSPKSQEKQKYALQAIHCYQGQFLDNEPEDAWLLSCRKRTQQQLKKLSNIVHLNIENNLYVPTPYSVFSLPHVF